MAGFLLTYQSGQRNDGGFSIQFLLPFPGLISCHQATKVQIMKHEHHQVIHHAWLGMSVSSKLR